MPKKPAKKALAKKTMKKTKGGILIGLNQPAIKPPTFKPTPILPQPGTAAIPPICN